MRGRWVELQHPWVLGVHLPKKGGDDVQTEGTISVSYEPRQKPDGCPDTTYFFRGGGSLATCLSGGWASGLLLKLGDKPQVTGLRDSSDAKNCPTRFD